jgi:hypothetical protein
MLSKNSRSEGAVKHMSKPTPQFSPESIAQIAAIILSQPLNLNHKMTFQDACAKAHNLLVAAQRSNEERAAALAATSPERVAEIKKHAEIIEATGGPKALPHWTEAVND